MIDVFETVEWDLGNGVTIQANLDPDKREVLIILHGRRCGTLVVEPRSQNSISLRATGSGVPQEDRT